MVGPEAVALRGCSNIVAGLHGQAGASGACQLPSSARTLHSVHARCLQGPAVPSAAGAELCPQILLREAWLQPIVCDLQHRTGCMQPHHRSRIRVPWAARTKPQTRAERSRPY